MLVDPGLTGDDALRRAADTQFQRRTRARTVAEWTCDLLVRDDGAPVWRGDVVQVGSHGRFYVLAFEAHFASEPDWRPTRYLGERIA